MRDGLVRTRAVDVGEAVARTRRATEGQIEAPQNMLSGVEKWLHKNDE